MSAYLYVRRLVVVGLAVACVVGAAGPAGAVAAAVRVVPGVAIVPPGPGSPTPFRVNNRGQVLLFLSGLIWQRGRYTDVGSLGGAFTGAWDLNDAGDVVGESELADHTNHGFRWRQGRMTDLGTLGGANSIATSVGANGDVAGRSELPDGTEHAFFWRAGTMVDTGIPSGFVAQVHINGQGRIAADDGGSRAYTWYRGVRTDLGSLGGGSTQVLAINDRGEIVGMSSTAAGEFHAFRWRQGRMTDLGTLGGTESVPLDINNRGQIVGRSTIANGPEHAFRWENGVMTDLAPADGNRVVSYAAAINERGDVIGDRLGETGTRGVVWRGNRRLELSTLGGETSQGAGINDAGLAVGLTTADSFDPPRGAAWDTSRIGS